MSHNNDGLLIVPERFDFDSHAFFKQQCERLLAIEGLKQIVLDFSKVRYIDSAALGLLVLLHRKASPKGVELAIQGAVGGAREILDIANLQRFYNIV